MCPKRDDCGQEGIHMSKKGQFQGKKWSAHPKMGQEGVRVSKKAQYWARNGRHVQIGQERVQRRPKTGQEGVSASEKGRFRARRGQRIQKRTVPGKKGSARPKKDGSGQERVGMSKSSRDRSKEGRFRARR